MRPWRSWRFKLDRFANFIATKEDIESPYGQWTRVEAICDGDKVTYLVNGKVVNAGTHSKLTEGKILFQSEGAEVFYRRVDLEPLTTR